MKSIIDVTRFAQARHSNSQLRARLIEAEHIAPPEALRWTESAHERSAATQRERSALVAYYLSEARGFVPGHDVDDWLIAQAQIESRDAGIFEG
jgi:hypothetical protein